MSSGSSASVVPGSIMDFADLDAWAKRYLYPHILDDDSACIADYEDDGAITIPFMNQRFCDELIQHAEKFKWRTDRHANYPTTDNELKDIGLGVPYDYVLDTYVYRKLLKYLTQAQISNDKYVAESFIVKYEASGDRQLALDPHFDDAAFTVILTLNDAFEGGGTYFLYKQKRVQERPGILTVHPGIYLERHAGLPITAGTRYISVSFVRRRKWPQ